MDREIQANRSNMDELINETHYLAQKGEITSEECATRCATIRHEYAQAIGRILESRNKEKK